MTMADWPWTILGIAAGAFCGLILGMMTGLFLFKGYWILLVLALPLIIAQFIFEGAFYGVVALWKRWRGTSEPVELAPVEAVDRPWLRRYSFGVGFVPVAAYGVFAILRAA